MITYNKIKQYIDIYCSYERDYLNNTGSVYMNKKYEFWLNHEEKFIQAYILGYYDFIFMVFHDNSLHFNNKYVVETKYFLSDFENMELNIELEDELPINSGKVEKKVKL